MGTFFFHRNSFLSQQTIYQISTDIENFHKVMPNYFKSIEIIEKNKNELIVREQIKFMGFNLKIKSKHVIKPPNIHEVHILSGPTKGSKFIEKYFSDKNGSRVTIEVILVFSGFMKIFQFLERYVAKKMSNVMSEFIISAEKYHSKKLSIGS